MTFDLDPGEGVALAADAGGRQLVQTLLDELGLPAFLKTSGGKGLHVVVPITPPATTGTRSRASRRRSCSTWPQTIPERFVAKSGPQNRVGKIFVDYLRNGFGATTVCAWSARSRPGLGVSVPLDWDELADADERVAMDGRATSASASPSATRRGPRWRRAARASARR